MNKEISVDNVKEKTNDPLHLYRNELNIVFHKNQEAFEKQLSFIAAGSLTLSVGFIHDIVKNFEKSSNKVLIGIGWTLLVLTLLVNLISHMIAARNANTGIGEINLNKYDPLKIEVRNKRVVRMNWVSVILMIIGISLIILFIIINTLL